MSGIRCKNLWPSQEYSTSKEREQCAFVCMCLRLKFCSASGSHELFVWSNCRPTPNCEYVFVCVCVIPLHATIWPESETLKYHTVGPARCQGVRVPRWLGCLTKTFSLSGIRYSFQVIFHFDIKVFFFFLNLTLNSPWNNQKNSWPLPLALLTFPFKIIDSNSLEFANLHTTQHATSGIPHLTSKSYHFNNKPCFCFMFCIYFFIF